jgi:inosine-uridine nucleoside N-ribohydrolase
MINNDPGIVNLILQGVVMGGSDTIRNSTVAAESIIYYDPITAH